MIICKILGSLVRVSIPPPWQLYVLHATAVTVWQQTSRQSISVGGRIEPAQRAVGDGDHHLIQCFSSPWESSSQSGRRSVQPFLYSPSAWDTDWCTPGSPIAIVRMHLMHSMQLNKWDCMYMYKPTGSDKSKIYSLGTSLTYLLILTRWPNI